MYNIPFVAELSVSPNRANGRKLEYLRDLERMARKAYLDLKNNFEGISNKAIVQDGAGASYAGQEFVATEKDLTDATAASSPSRYSALVKSVSHKYQQGQYPAILMINGFCDGDQVPKEAPDGTPWQESQGYGRSKYVPAGIVHLGKYTMSVDSTSSGETDIASTGSGLTFPDCRENLSFNGSTRDTGWLTEHVVALKGYLEAAITSIDYTIIRINVAGVLYGQNGVHFPRS